MSSPLAGPEPWDLVAEGYAAEAHWVMLPFSKRAAELAALTRDSVVLDVATGPGTLALYLAPRVKKVHALDFAPTMIAELESRARAAGLENIEARVGDGQALPYGNDDFDAAFSMFGLMFFPDRARGFAELLRVLKPGARAVVSSWAPIAESSLISLMFGALRAADPERVAPPPDALSLENPARFAEELTLAGFENVSVLPCEQALDTPSPQELWTSMVKSSAPLALLRKKLGEQQWLAQSEKAQRYIEDDLARAPRTLSTKAFLGVGRKPERR